jgi:hypothetical protein
MDLLPILGPTNWLDRLQWRFEGGRGLGEKVLAPNGNETTVTSLVTDHFIDRTVPMITTLITACSALNVVFSNYTRKDDIQLRGL